MGILLETMGAIKVGEMAAKTLKNAGKGLSELNEKIKKSMKNSIEKAKEKAELLGTKYCLCVFITDCDFNDNSSSYEYSVYDKDGYELYKIKNEKAKCKITNCCDPKRKLAVLFREKKNIRYYTMVEGTRLSEIICDSSVTRKIVKDDKGSSKRSIVKEYKFRDKGWILEEEKVSHKATLAKTRGSEPIVTILYSGNNIVIGYDDKSLEETALLTACLTLVEESKVDKD